MPRIVSVAQLDTDSKRFAVRLTLQGSCDVQQYWDVKKQALEEYMSVGGIEEQSGERVSLTFFGEALRAYKQELKEGRTATMSGGMVSIRHARSVSTVKVDLKFDRYATLKDWVSDVKPRMPVIVQLRSLLESHRRPVGDVVLVYLSSTDCISLKKPSEKHKPTVTMPRPSRSSS